MTQQEIIRLREILSRFYDGSGNEEERREAISLLQREECPDEFRGELEVLEAFTHSTPVAEGLDRMLAQTDSLLDDFKRKRRHRLWRIITLTATSAAVLAAFLIPGGVISVKDGLSMRDGVNLAVDKTVSGDSVNKADDVPEMSGVASVSSSTTAVDSLRIENRRYISHKRDVKKKIAVNRSEETPFSLERDTLPTAEDIEFALTKIGEACDIYNDALAMAGNLSERSQSALAPALKYLDSSNAKVQDN